MKVVKDISISHPWMIIIIVFVLVRVIIFATFWVASADKGGWLNFYHWSQPASQNLPAVFLTNFHENCDWHPPLYYTMTSFLTLLFHNQWAIYIVQIILSFFSVWLSYKISRLFFSEKISLVVAFLLAIEPYGAWFNFIFASEALAVPLFLIGLYFFFKFLKFQFARDLIWSAIFLGLATLTRPNFLLITIALSVVLCLLVLLRNKLKLSILPKLSYIQFLKYLVIFNLLFFGILFPWMARNQIIYGRLTIANILYTNPYYFTLPPLVALKEKVPLDQAFKLVSKRANEALGKNVGDQGNCHLFSREEFNRQLDFYGSQTRNYILANPWLYAKLHLTKVSTFFLQPGCFDMWSAYTGEYKKPDITGAILKGDFVTVVKFLADLNPKLIAYLLGVCFWGFSTSAMIGACFYSYFYDRGKFAFFMLNLGMVCYSALLVSPSFSTRYRLPFYSLFFIALVYVLIQLVKRFKGKKHEA